MTEWRFNQVDYRYKQSEIKTLDAIEGRFQTGKSYQVFGDISSGKSTFLALLAGLIVCSGGTLTFADKELSSIDRNKYRGREVACLFQRGSLLKDSPLANLEMEILLSGARLDKEELKRGLLSVGLSESRLTVSINRLTEKERQLVNLAKILVKKTAKLILVDEPEQVFSECGVAFAMNKLKQHSLQQKNCLIFTTRTTQSVKFADELWGLNGGKLLFIKEQAFIL